MSRQKRIFPTMLTPYSENGDVDYEGVKALVEWYWKQGCDGIFAVCQSSEIFFLSLEERVKIARTVVTKAKELAAIDGSRAPMTIVASGHVSDSFAMQVRELTEIAACGVDAIVLISNRMDMENTSEGKWIEDMEKLVAALPKDIPLGMYECPKPYKRLLSENMIRAMLKTGRFEFIKDTCCDAELMKERLRLTEGSKLKLYNANAQTLRQTVLDGAEGYCGIMVNYHPEIYRILFDNLENEVGEIAQSFIGISAFTELGLAYPSSAKYYLNEYEGIKITDISRSVDHRLLTPYQKECLRQMKVLEENILRQIKERKGR